MTQAAFLITVVDIGSPPDRTPRRDCFVAALVAMTALCCHCERSDAISCRPRWSTEMPQPGPRNLITDVRGLLVGQAEDIAGITSTSVVLCEAPAVAAVDVRGGAPGSRDTELLRSGTLVERIDAIVLSGGSAFGLDAAAGVMEGLAALRRGIPIRDARLP